jgi:hypothetical protein
MIWITEYLFETIRHIRAYLLVNDVRRKQLSPLQLVNIIVHILNLVK